MGWFIGKPRRERAVRKRSIHVDGDGNGGDGGDGGDER
jgi:hypothetical protein